MANLKEIRNRITSVQSTKQITSAMKMVSAAKLRKAQDAILQMRPYSNELRNIITNLKHGIEGEVENPFMVSRPIERVLLVMITSNKGLCGGFNANVSKLLINSLKTKYKSYARTSKVDIVGIGKKGIELLRAKQIPIINDNNQIYDDLTYDNSKAISDELIELFLNGTYDKIVLYYNRFKNAGVQELREEELLPLYVDCSNVEENGSKNYIYEPSQQEILDDLIPQYIKVRFFKCLLESVASEHGARMTAMHKATDNATELVKDLTLTYNKARQAAITNEILEIVSGAEALK